ncbi:MAG: DNA gyrase subunit A [bacterium]
MPKQEKLDIIKIGTVTDAPIVDEMKKSYLDYALSVIVSRALPDVRDGLKPVHRRILYAMWNIGLRHTAKFRKSAHVIGEVMAKYHPHGDASIYDAMVRMAQDFSMRVPLVHGQGNFGSMDGDNAAAMRYTEAKLRAVAEEMLFDIEKQTVDFKPNYDGSHLEPWVLPTKVPNLLVNGTTGIAVGMATSIPPHNLSEVCDGVIKLIEKPTTTIDDLIEIIQGPDFPTGGIIYNKKDMAAAFSTGRGGVVIRAKTDIREDRAGKFKIIVTEIPYMVNKATLIGKIATLVQEKKIEGIKDLRDESSNKDGVRIVIELKKDSYPKKILNRLYKLTDLQTTFHYNMLALVDGLQPRVLNLKNVLEEFIKHRQEVIKRRTQFELDKAKERAHILEGLKKALDKINEVIKTIQASKDKEQAKVNLIKKFKFTEKQTLAILEMKLQQLANLERKKILDELKEKKELIKEQESILDSEKKMMAIIKKETQFIKEKYGEDRRTQIITRGIKDFRMEDLVPNESTIIMVTSDGYIKRLPPDTFKQQSRGGKGVIGLTTKEQDAIDMMQVTNTHDNILFFTSRGRTFQMMAYDIPQSSRTAKGQAMVNFLQLAPNEKVTATLAMSDLTSAKYLVMVTQKGITKKTALEDFANVRKSGLIAIKLKSEDSLEWVKPSYGKNEIIIATKKGQAIRFKEKNIRAMGRSASGVRGIRLKNNDQVICMNIIDPKNENLELLTISENGLGKRTPLAQYRLQGRGGSGIKSSSITAKTGDIVQARVADRIEFKDRDLIIMSIKGQVIRLPYRSVSSTGRTTQGVRLMRFKATGDRVGSITLL